MTVKHRSRMTDEQKEEFYELSGRCYNDGMAWPTADYRAEELMMGKYVDLEPRDFDEVVFVNPNEDYR